MLWLLLIRTLYVYDPRGGAHMVFALVAVVVAFHLRRCRRFRRRRFLKSTRYIINPAPSRVHVVLFAL